MTSKLLRTIVIVLAVGIVADLFAVACKRWGEGIERFARTVLDRQHDSRPVTDPGGAPPPIPYGPLSPRD